MKRSVIALVAALLTLAVLLSFSFLCADEIAAVYAADSYSGWATDVFHELDYGIYWYGSGEDVPVKAGTEGASFDPEKPTVIFTHGMKQNEGFNRRDLLTLWGNTSKYFVDAGFDAFEFGADFYQEYIDNGYNVGHFYWSQISDDDISGDVKIWSSTSEKGMSYYVSDSNGKRVQGDPSKNPTESVAILYGKAIRSALGEDYDKPLQLTGHSMGGQLTLAVTDYLIALEKKGEVGGNLLPERVTLMDPYFGVTVVNSPIDHLDGEAGGGRTVSELASYAMERIADRGIATEAYCANTSFISRLYAPALKAKGEEVTKRLTDNCAWVYLDALQEEYTVAKTHCMVVDYYFSTLYEESVNDNFGNPVPYALMDTATLKLLAGNGYKQTNVEGNPFYMHTSAFVRVTPDGTPIEDTAAGTVLGKVDNKTGGQLTAKLIDNAGNVVATSALSSAGEYRFKGIAAGDYTVKLYAADTEIITSETVSVKLESNSSLVNVKAVTANNSDNSLVLWIFAGAVGLVVVVSLVVFIVKKSKNGKKKAVVKGGK